MKILMIAPQPFFEPRGTPISVYQRVNALSKLGHEVDLVTYHLGESPDIPNVHIHRTIPVPFVNQIKIGPSWIKPILDVLVFFKSFLLLVRGRYDVIHTHEEAAFFGYFLAPLFQVPHLYDMHSSLPRQLESFGVGNFWPLKQIFAWFENAVISSCAAVITIDSELADRVKQINPNVKHMNIENTAVSFSAATSSAEISTAEQIKDRLNLHDRTSVIYTGTFEKYQGLDLVVRSVAAVKDRHPTVKYVMVGGKPHQVQELQDLTDELGLGEWIVFTGMVSPEESLVFLEVADVLFSSRIEGTSVPLKVYSYLHAAKPIVATNLEAHTQVFNHNVSVLVDPTVEGMSAGVIDLLDSPDLMARLAAAAGRYAEEHYSVGSYLRKVENIYKQVETPVLPTHMGKNRPLTPPPGHSYEIQVDET
ncbi:MAG: glycosyltransferase family 4 protein [Anaerolineae bacterium]